jgi:hypothetical protein
MGSGMMKKLDVNLAVHLQLRKITEGTGVTSNAQLILSFSHLLK